MSTDSRTLFQLTADMAAIEDALYETGGELTPEIEQALQETAQSLAVKTDSYNALMRKFGAQADIIDAEIKRLTALKRTCQNAEKRLREHICETMQMFGIEKLEGQFCKMSLGKSTRVETNDEKLTETYVAALNEFAESLPSYLTVEMKVSKTGIKEYEKETGILPAGAEKVESVSLRIR